MPTSTASSTHSSPTITTKAAAPPKPPSRTASPKTQPGGGSRAGSAVPPAVGVASVVGKGRSRTSTPTPMVLGQGKVGVKLENDEAGEVGLRQSGSPARSLRAGSAVTVGSAGNHAGNGAVKEKRDRRSSSKEGVEGMGAGVGVPTVIMGKEREGSAGSARKSVDKDVAGDANHLQPPPRAGGPPLSTSGIPPPQAFPAVLSRPPIRPPISSISKSKFDLEPNPFEQSFSRSSTSIHSHQTGSSSEDIRRETGRTRRETETGGMTTSKMSSPPVGKTALPPVSALTSPAPLEPGPHFSWSGLSSSLRAGPLSPAMLTGPAGHNAMTHGPSALGANSASTGMTPQAGNGAFDPSNFRTGFTPGGGTGFTPGFGSMMGMGSMVNGMPAFPLPSPNTAAFLSMVTNNTPGGAGAGEGSNAASVVNGSQIGAASNANGPPGAGQGSINGDAAQARRTSNPAQNGPLPGGPGPSAMVDITPNTLNALTGVINQMDQEERQMEETRRYNGQQQVHPGHLGPQGPPPPPVQRPGQPDMPAHPVHPGQALMHHADSYFPHQPMGMQGGPGPHNGTGNPHQFHPGPMHGHGPPGPGGHPGPHGTLPPSHLHQGGMRPAQMDYVRTDTNGHPLPPPPGPEGPGGAQGAVNGLFLLSQAHQELSKREEQEQHVEPSKPGGKKGGKGANKRKSSDAAAPTKVKPPAKKSKKAAPVEPPSPDFMNSMGDSDDDMMGSMNGYDDDDMNRGDRKPETEEEKRKNFLERNRQAALKCRQRKKAWLGQLQTKVDGLSGENERLRSIIQNLTDEVGRISAVLSSHRDCPGMPASMAQLGISLPPPGMPGPPVMQGMMQPPGPGPVSHAPPGSYRHNSAAPSNFGSQSQPQAV